MVDIFLGSQLHHTSEKKFLKRLSSDLEKSGIDAIIFANFYTIYKYNQLQIDFFIIVANCVCHVELKNFTAPVKGAINGSWFLISPNGACREIKEGTNPYCQTLNGKYALSNEMNSFMKKERSLPAPIQGKNYFRFFESVLCIFPELLQDSNVPSDYKVQVKDYKGFLDLLKTSNLNPGWTKKQWVEFAMYLSLMRNREMDEPLDPETKNAVESVNDYSRRFRDFHSQELHELVPTTLSINQSLQKSDKVLDFLLRNKHGQLIGKSGCGKTNLVIHMALHAIASEIIPIFLPVKHYEGEFLKLISQNIAHLYPDTGERFLHDISKSGKCFVLIVDGFNECPEAFKKTLIQELQAFYLRQKTPILLTAQEDISLPEGLNGEKVYFADLSGEEKRAIFASYVGKKSPKEFEKLCEPFKTAHDLKIAAECFSKITGIITRARLLAIYIHHCLERTSNIHIARMILMEIAKHMKDSLVNVLSITDFWHIVTPFFSKDPVPPFFQNELVDCGLIEIQQGRCFFRHEQFQNFFEAEAFLAVEHYELEITKPRNRHLAEIVIGLKNDAGSVASCIRNLADQRILSECLYGHFGESAREIVLNDAFELLKTAEKELRTTDIKFDFSNTESFWGGLTVSEQHKWSDYEYALMQAIGGVLRDGFFIPEVFSLIDKTESACFEKIGRKDFVKTLDKQFHAHLFSNLYVLFPKEKVGCLPISIIIKTVHNDFRLFEKPRLVEKAVELYEKDHKRTPGQLYALCLLLNKDEHAAYLIPDLLWNCWVTGIYHLRLQILQEVQTFTLEGQLFEKTKSILSTLETGNFSLNSQLVETLNSFGLVQSPIDTEGALDEISGILALPDNQQAREHAYGVVGCIFEDIFQGAYSEAYHSLPREKKIALLNMGALGVPGSGFYIDWILRELLNFDSNTLLPAFERWATEIDADSFSTHEATVSFIYSQIGCAKFMSYPPVLKKLETTHDQTWQTFGEIIFWVYNPGFSEKEIQSKCAPLWKKLIEDLPLEAVDALMHFESAFKHRVFLEKATEKTTMRGFEDIFKEPVRELLEFGLLNVEKLSSIFIRARSFYDRKECTVRIIEKLGEIGNLRTVRLLEPLIDSPDFGLVAIKAVQKIKSSFF